MRPPARRDLPLFADCRGRPSRRTAANVRAVVSDGAPARCRQQRLRRVAAAFASLPERYLGRAARASTPPTRSGSATSGRTLGGRSSAPSAARCAPRRAASPTSSSAPTPRPGSRCARAGSRASTPSPQRRLYARGDLDLALGFEGLFRLPAADRRWCASRRPRSRGATISTLTAGDGAEHVVCLHGLGGNKTSFFETVAALTPDYTVHAIDLPGLRLLLEARPRPLRRRLVRAARSRASWTRSGSSAPT